MTFQGKVLTVTALVVAIIFICNVSSKTPETMSSQQDVGTAPSIIPEVDDKTVEMEVPSGSSTIVEPDQPSPLFNERVSDEFMSHLAILNSGTNIVLVLRTIETISRDTHLTELFQRYMQERSIKVFPYRWGFAQLAERWEDQSLSNLYYDEAVAAYLDKESKSFWRALKVILESEWESLYDLTDLAMNDEDPEIRFTFAHAMATARSGYALQKRKELLNDSDQYVRAVAKLSDQGKGAMLTRFADYKKLSVVGRTREKFEKTGKKMVFHYDRNTGEFTAGDIDEIEEKRRNR